MGIPVAYIGAGAPEPPPMLAQAISRASAKHAVPPELLAAVAWVESRYKPGLTGKAGEQGEFQLMPATAAGLGVINAFDANQGADGAARLLKSLYARFGQWPLALAAYNWGGGHVAARPDPIDWPDSVQRYVTRVWEAAGWPLPLAVPPALVVGRERIL